MVLVKCSKRLHPKRFVTATSHPTVNHHDRIRREDHDNQGRKGYVRTPKKERKLFPRLTRFLSLAGTSRLFDFGSSMSLLDIGDVNIGVLFRSINGVIEFFLPRRCWTRLIDRRVLFSSLAARSRFSISPRVVTPLVAKFSSEMAVYFTTPRLAAISSVSCKNSCRRAVVRLFFVGAISDAKAVIDKR